MPAVQELDGLWAGEAYADLNESLELSLAPSGAEWLLELFASLGPQQGQVLLDVRARDAKHAIRLGQEHGVFQMPGKLRPTVYVRERRG